MDEKLENKTNKENNSENLNDDLGNNMNIDASGFFTLSYKNGDKFSGQITKGSVESFGIYQKQSNGLTFEGDFNKNFNSNNSQEIKLKGKLTFDNGNSIYEGEILNGKFDGKGILVNANGDTYEGDFKNGVKEGQGIFLFA